MNTPEQYEREIADRDRLIARLRAQLTAALDEIVRLRTERNGKAEKAA